MMAFLRQKTNPIFTPPAGGSLPEKFPKPFADNGRPRPWASSLSSLPEKLLGPFADPGEMQQNALGKNPKELGEPLDS
jgi:hypothetical protein